MKHVLFDQRYFYAYDEVEKARHFLLENREKITVSDHGAGKQKEHTKSVRKMVSTSVKPAWQARLIFRIAEHYACHTILELGTSAGLTTLYLAATGNTTRVITLEGDPAIAAIAEKNFRRYGSGNITLVKGKFEDTLKESLVTLGKADLIFFDGNHRKQPTLAYYHEALLHAHQQSIFIFDDIHWSPEMKEAWELIISDPAVTLSIDLYYFGIVFFQKKLSREHFILKY